MMTEPRLIRDRLGKVWTEETAQPSQWSDGGKPAVAHFERLHITRH